ncbi:MAG: ABC-2 type transport system ATP-binding protein [Bradymonadia bacterium]|jgi:ABC-2 type transport system ATP-binding protein
MTDTVLSVQNLSKTFKIGFFRKKVVAVRNATFDVSRGEVFGIVGPNGAGKSTTIKMILGLIRPDAGTGHVFGKSIESRAARNHIAFLPETPSFYDHLKPGELLDYFGDLYGLDTATKKKRIPELIERVGLSNAIHKPIRKFSKGMVQRIGLAQALLPEADIIVLDEPQSGLDPLGRKDVRDLILEQRDAGRTVIFSSHILNDVEQICDRVAILTAGVVRQVGPLSEIVSQGVDDVEIRIRATPELAAELAEANDIESMPDGTYRWTVAESEVQQVLRGAMEKGIQVIAVVPHRRDLEDVFVEATLGTADDR